jgi:hypothetical protein
MERLRKNARNRRRAPTSSRVSTTFRSASTPRCRSRRCSRYVAKEATLAARASVGEHRALQPEAGDHALGVRGLNQDRDMRLDKRMRTRRPVTSGSGPTTAPIAVEDTTRDKRANCSDFVNHFEHSLHRRLPLSDGQPGHGCHLRRRFRSQDDDRDAHAAAHRPQSSSSRLRSRKAVFTTRWSARFASSNATSRRRRRRTR